jgi:hypothetical protein
MRRCGGNFDLALALATRKPQPSRRGALEDDRDLLQPKLTMVTIGAVDPHDLR